MSLLHVALCEEGILLGADTRTVYTTDPVTICDETHKAMSIFKGKYGVAWAGVAETNGISIEQLILNFEGENTEFDSVRGFTNSLQSDLAQNFRPTINKETRFFIVGYDEDQPRIYRFSINEGEIGAQSSVKSIIPEGFPPPVIKEGGAHYHYACMGNVRALFCLHPPILRRIDGYKPNKAMSETHPTAFAQQNSPAFYLGRMDEDEITDNQIRSQLGLSGGDGIPDIETNPTAEAVIARLQCITKLTHDWLAEQYPDQQEYRDVSETLCFLPIFQPPPQAEPS